MIDYVAIGRRIASARKDKKITQAKLAELLEISNTYIGKVESGKTKISLPRLYQIADILETDISVLVSDGRCFADFDFKSEIEEKIKDWSADERLMLTSLIQCYNEKKKSN